MFGSFNMLTKLISDICKTQESYAYCRCSKGIRHLQYCHFWVCSLKNSVNGITLSSMNIYFQLAGLKMAASLSGIERSSKMKTSVAIF